MLRRYKWKEDSKIVAGPDTCNKQQSQQSNWKSRISSGGVLAFKIIGIHKLTLSL